RIDSGRGMPLKIDDVAFAILAAGAKEMIEGDLVKRGRRSIGGNVAANSRLLAIGAHNHGERIPASETFDAPLDFLISGIRRLGAGGNGVYVRGVGRERQGDAGFGRMLLHALKNLCSSFAAMLLENKIQGVEPFPQFDVLHLR